MSRRLSRSTLFPYTTLFRSEHHGLGAAFDRPLAHAIMIGVGPEHGDGVAGAGLDPHIRRAVRETKHQQPVWPVLDRKSTRLNSSHVEISYAVFCLKKKKNNI